MHTKHLEGPSTKEEDKEQLQVSTENGKEAAADLQKTDADIGGGTTGARGATVPPGAKIHYIEFGPYISFPKY